MTDLPNAAADPAVNGSTLDGETTEPVTDATEPVADATEPVADATEPVADATERIPEADGALADTTTTVEAGVQAVPVLPLAAATTDEVLPPSRPRRRRSIVKRFAFSFVVGFVLAFGVGAGVLYAWSQQYDGRILPGVRIGNTDLGGLTREQAEAAIKDAYQGLGTGQITLNGPDGQVTTLSYADVGRGPDTPALLDAAFDAGRQGEPVANVIGGLQVATHGVTLDSAVTYDRDKLAAAVETLATTLDETPADASVSAGHAGTFVVTPAKDGRAVDQAALLTALDQPLAALDTPASVATAVPIVTLAPTIATASAQAAQAAADRMAADVMIVRGKETWKVAGTSVAPLISFSTADDGTVRAVLDESGLDPIVKRLAKQVNQKVRDAGLKLVKGRVIVTGSSREGRTLIPDGMKAALVNEIGARQTGAAASPVAAVVKAVDPKLSTADARAFAPKMRAISKYSVFYWVIVNNHWGGNIEGPATVINGTVVPAGAKFDFWKVVGDLHDAPGVGPGNAIEGGKITVTGAFGGGICTTSTTLFNAAFRAGMIPLARQNHNEFIDRYPPGLDATVWIVGKTKQTMSFRNDTKYPILITRTVTHAGNKRWLTFKIWSVPNGRTAKVTNLSIQHGPRARSTIVKDPTKPAGYRYLNNPPANGAKVAVTVSIYDHGKLHWRKRFFSNYPAVNGVTVVGTKRS